jgi:hypothetical protein
MTLEQKDLDDVTRPYMVAELDFDEKSGGPYLSPRLSPDGVNAYPNLLRQAIVTGNDQTLEVALSGPGMFNATETYERNGTIHERKMNRQAPRTLAEGEFNRYYIRGLCARLGADGGGTVEVYRARSSS